jgi:hypothetical protein
MANYLDTKICNHILIPRLDTFGDIGLLEGFISALLGYLPEVCVALLVWERY